MNSLHVFILLELFTFRKFKKVDDFTLTNFRHIVSNYIRVSSTYDEFISLLSKSSLQLDKDICALCLLFKRYVKEAYKIWCGLESS